jgi:hypothetical protein
MQVKKLSCWEDFEGEIPFLSEEIKKIQAKKGMQVRDPLFRGLVSASWKLETTIERYSTRQYSMHEYYNVMRAVRPAVESFTEKSWNLSDEYNVDETIPALLLVTTS